MIAKVTSSLQLLEYLKNAAQCYPKQYLSETCNQNCYWTMFYVWVKKPNSNLKTKVQSYDSLKLFWTRI